MNNRGSKRTSENEQGGSTSKRAATDANNRTPKSPWASKAIDPSLIYRVNAHASSNPELQDLLSAAAAGGASPDQMRALGDWLDRIKEEMKREQTEQGRKSAAQNSDNASNSTSESPNSESESPSALIRAKAAIDRLDFKSGVELCSEILRSNPDDPTQTLLLRSFGLERRDRFKDATKDIEEALKGEQSREIHLRAGFNHLALALDHFVRAQWYQPQEEATMASHLSNSDLGEIELKLLSLKDRELQSPFKRLSPELFIEVMSSCDSPSIAKSSSVCKSWNKSVLEAKSLFQSFKMEGKISNIIKGIQVFGQRSDNSIKSIDIEIGSKVTMKEQKELQESISPSSETIKVLIFLHQGGLSKLILNISSDCKELKSLTSARAKVGNHINWSFSASTVSSIAFPVNWEPKLEKFEWKVETLLCDDSLIKYLQDCKEVTLWSEVQSSWAVKLLSSNSKLVTFSAPYSQEEGSVDIIPEMNLPKLKHLALGQIPRVNIGTSSFFFKQLQAPNLRLLRVKNLHPQDLSFLPEECPIRTLTISRLTIEAGEEAALMMVESMKHWKYLSHLNLLFPGSAEFWSSFLGLLQPLSRINITRGYKNHFLFPKLVSLGIGNTIDPQNTAAISALDLGCLMASRQACSRRLSYKHLLLAGSGDLEASALPPPGAGSGEEIPFSGIHIDPIQFLKVYSRIEGDEATLSWVRKRFRGLPSR